ncbi:MAG: DUF3108 domain-containing protein [Ignavibacteriales bacterium]|nr:DUF3108 domain-containing protein [Ignavibacteriales bacterium]
MNMFRHTLSVSRFLILLLALQPGEAPAQLRILRSPFSDGEVLRYKVKWNFIRVGTVMISQREMNERGMRKTVVHMAARSTVPLVNVELRHQGLIRHDMPALESVRIITGEDSAMVSDFIHQDDTLILVDSVAGSAVRADTLRWVGPLYDGVSLLMVARILSAGNEQLTLPTVNNYQIGRTDLEFTGETEMIDAAALRREIRCRRIRGVAHWDGKSFAGMSGDFVAWISDDEAAVPLRAEVSIVLGSIVLELESYERREWPDMETIRHAAIN